MNRTTSLEHTRRRRPSPIAIVLAALIGLAVVVTGGAIVAATIAPDDSTASAASNGSAPEWAGSAPSYGSTDGWPSQGQGAYVLGDADPAVSVNQKPVPIASVAKVMTAYLVLKEHPLAAGSDGPTFTVDEQAVDDTEARIRQGQSVVPVAVGEQLSERDALMAILLPSANNVAVLVARESDDGLATFVAEMNTTARELGMTQTTYTDPSGYDPGTVSTALDQLRLAQVVAQNETLADMMSTRSYELPVAGEITNTNALLGTDGFVGMKTGSDDAAGGCFMFRAVRQTADGDVTLIGVVLGQRGPSLIGAGLQAAQDLADRVAPVVAGSGPRRLSRSAP